MQSAVLLEREVAGRRDRRESRSRLRVPVGITRPSVDDRRRRDCRLHLVGRCGTLCLLRLRLSSLEHLRHEDHSEREDENENEASTDEHEDALLLLLLVSIRIVRIWEQGGELAEHGILEADELALDSIGRTLVRHRSERLVIPIVVRLGVLLDVIVLREGIIDDGDRLCLFSDRLFSMLNRLRQRLILGPYRTISERRLPARLRRLRRTRGGRSLGRPLWGLLRRLRHRRRIGALSDDLTVRQRESLRESLLPLSINDVHRRDATVAGCHSDENPRVVMTL